MNLRKFFKQNILLLSMIVYPNSLRIFLLKLAGMKIGRNVYIDRFCIFDPYYTENIEIEDDVFISKRVMIFCHNIPNEKKKNNKNVSNSIEKVILKKGCKIESSSIILKGATIGENSIVKCKSVVNKN